MKNARSYEPKIRKLITEARKQKVESSEVAVDDPVSLIIEAILADDARADQVGQAMAAIGEEFVDLNEFRVCISSEIVACIGKDLPCAHEKAQTIAQVLHGIYGRASSMSVEYMRQYSKRDVRRHLQELGLSPYAEALVSMTVFEVHAIPVDAALVDALIVTGCVDEETDVADTQAFLERVINQKDNMTAHVFFRKYIRTHWTAIEKKRTEEAEARKAAEKAARKAEQAAREAREAKAREEEKEAKKAKKARTAEKKKAKSTKKTAKKTTAKKTTKKETAKKTTKKTAKKAARKKAAKNATKKAAKKKATKKSRKKATKTSSSRTSTTSKSAKKKKSGTRKKK
ncbi:MAG: hypothetical protein GVY16_02005 [Planctomycetes bacterium]|jgi:chemotaxis protein histidine kinase CheA|nr:hypothetical protein [Planctomycetota bacterium]